jgi:hypothetical protein
MTNWTPAWGSRAIPTTRIATIGNSAWRLSRTTDIWPTVRVLRAGASTGSDGGEEFRPMHNSPGKRFRMAIACR